MKKRLSFLLLVLITSFIATPASAVTLDELKTAIELLSSQVLALQIGGSVLGATTQLIGDIDETIVMPCLDLPLNLRYRNRDTQMSTSISSLQDFLATQNYFDQEPTGYFGPYTLKAVKSFQQANGLLPTGFVGPYTRAKIKAISCDINHPTENVKRPDTTSMQTSSPQPPTTTLNLIKVLSPNGGETWKVRDYKLVSWQGATGPYDVSLLSDRDEYTIVKNHFFTRPFEFDWEVGSNSGRIGNVPDGSYYIKVCVAGSVTACDKSDSYFKIVSENTNNINVTYPNGGTIEKGGHVEVIWATSQPIKNIGIGFCLESEGYSGAHCSDPQVVSNTGKASISTALLSPGRWQVYVVDRDSLNWSDYGVSGAFNVTAVSSFKVLYPPVDGVSYYYNEGITIAWEPKLPGIARVDLLDANNNYLQTIYSKTFFGNTVPNIQGYFVWTPNFTDVAGRRIRVYQYDPATYSTVGDRGGTSFTTNVFTVKGARVRVQAPNAGTYMNGAPITVLWSAPNLSVNDLLNITLVNAATNVTVATLASNVYAGVGSVTTDSLVTSDVPTGQYKVRITCNSNNYSVTSKTCDAFGEPITIIWKG